MTRVLWLEDNPEVASELPHRVVRPDEGLKVPEASDEERPVVVVGTTVGSSVSVAQRVNSIVDDPVVLVVCPEEQLDSLRQSLRMTPFIGARTRAVVADEQLEDEVEKAVSRAEKRREYGRVMKRAQAVLDGDVSSVQRPSPEQFAASMWSNSPVGAVAVLPDERHILSANPAASRVVGRPEIELVGTPVDEVLGDNEDWSWLSKLNGRKDLERVIAHTSEAGEQMHLEVRGARSAGREMASCWFFCGTSPSGFGFRSCRPSISRPSARPGSAPRRPAGSGRTCWPTSPTICAIR